MWWFKPLLFIACLNSVISTTQASILVSDSELFIAMQNRIKLFAHSVELPNALANAYKTLTFSRHGDQLQINNPSPYSISFHSLKVGGNEIKSVTMIAAKSTLTLHLPPGYSGSVSWQAISGFGGISPVATAIILNKPKR